MALFDSARDTWKSLKDVGYITDEATAAHIYLAASLNRPLLLEGPPGAGKTELANSVAKAGRMKFLRLQCYSGIKHSDAIGRYDRSLQELYVLLQSKSEHQASWEELKRKIASREFYVAGPLLEAIESPQRCVLLIDEIDKIEHDFEAMLLELLSVWQLSIPGMGTVEANTVPFTVMTSNAERPIGNALRRRSFFLLVDHPTATREAEIVSRKTPNCLAETHRFIAGFALALRTERLEKAPSISEMNDIALALDLLGYTAITDEHKELFLPLIAKTVGDRKRLLMKGRFESIVSQAVDEARKLTDAASDEIIHEMEAQEALA